MAASAIQWILFDFGGVVAEEGFRAGLTHLATHHGRDPEAVLAHAMDAVYASGFVTGTGSEADFWRELGERAGLWVDPMEGENAILSRFRLRPGMVALVRRLRGEGCSVGLLTDQTEWLERLDRRDGFLSEFDRVFNSFRLGKGKRDPTLFDEVAAALGVAPEGILFIDDAPGNVERARERGLQALLYEDEAAVERDLERFLGQA
jgi:putative hydrolase of the HAD superfamily